MREKIIVLGSGGHAKVVIDILNKMMKYEIVCAVVNDMKHDKEILDIPIEYGDDKLIGYFNNGIKNIAIGIGGYRNNLKRTSIFNFVKSLGFNVVNAIDPSARISTHTKIGEGNVIFPGVIINTEVVIGNNVIIATGSTIDHETIISDNVLISAGVTLGAYCKIKQGALLALGCKVISGIEIGCNALIASGAVVTKNVQDSEEVYGIPAKPRKRI